jgi:hypothetical protein
MFDEKSMIDLKMLLLIDGRLRVIFPVTSYLPFGGINVLISGDFYQLPSVGGKLLYSLRASHVDEIKGQQLYRVFNKTIRLTQVMRQLGDDPVSVWFRQTLGELQEDKLTQRGLGLSVHTYCQSALFRRARLYGQYITTVSYQSRSAPDKHSQLSSYEQACQEDLSTTYRSEGCQGIGRRG